MKVVSLKRFKGKKSSASADKCTVVVSKRDQTSNSRSNLVTKIVDTKSCSTESNQKLIMKTGLKREDPKTPPSQSNQVVEDRGDGETSEQPPKQEGALGIADNAFLTLGYYVGEGAVSASKAITDLTQGSGKVEERDSSTPYEHGMIEGAFLKLGEIVGEGAVTASQTISGKGN